MRSVLALVVLLACASTGVAREPGIRVGPPLVLRLEGAFAPDREHVTAAREDPVDMHIGDRERWFSTRTARTVGGDHPLSGRDVLNLLAPYQSSMVVTGSKDLRRKLRDVPDGTPVTVEGLLDRDSRTLLLRSVAVGSATP